MHISILFGGGCNEVRSLACSRWLCRCRNHCSLCKLLAPSLSMPQQLQMRNLPPQLSADATRFSRAIPSVRGAGAGPARVLHGLGSADGAAGRHGAGRGFGGGGGDGGAPHTLDP